MELEASSLQPYVQDNTQVGKPTINQPKTHMEPLIQCTGTWHDYFNPGYFSTPNLPPKS